MQESEKYEEYEAPRIEVLGSLQELTQGSTGSQPDALLPGNLPS